MFNNSLCQRAGCASFHLKDLLNVFTSIFWPGIIHSAQHECVEPEVLLLSDLL